jgi:hypothetical protein
MTTKFQLNGFDKYGTIGYSIHDTLEEAEAAQRENEQQDANDGIAIWYEIAEVEFPK